MGEGVSGGGGGSGEALGVVGGVIEDKGGQMGQTMGHRQPPGPSTTPASFRLHLF